MKVETFQRECDCDYPRDKEVLAAGQYTAVCCSCWLQADDDATALGANLTAFVHPQLQDNDFIELTEGAKIKHSVWLV